MCFPLIVSGNCLILLLNDCLLKGWPQFGQANSPGSNLVPDSRWAFAATAFNACMPKKMVPNPVIINVPTAISSFLTTYYPPHSACILGYKPLTQISVGFDVRYNLIDA